MEERGEGGAGVKPVQEERVGGCKEEQQGNWEEKIKHNHSFGDSVLGFLAITISKERR